MKVIPDNRSLTSLAVPKLEWFPTSYGRSFSAENYPTPGDNPFGCFSQFTQTRPNKNNKVPKSKQALVNIWPLEDFHRASGKGK